MLIFELGRVYFDIDSLPFLDFALISFYKVQLRCLNTGNFYGYTLRLRFWYPYYWVSNLSSRNEI